MIPARRLLALLAAWGLLGLVASLGWLPLAGWAGAGVLLALAAAADALWLRRAGAIEFARSLPPAFALGHDTEVTLSLRSDGAAARRLTLHDGHPGGWPVSGLPCRLTLEPRREIRTRYRARPLERGTVAFEGCEVREESRLGLWLGRRRLGGTDRVRVYPDFAPLARFALINAERASHITGAHLQRRRGEGTEFHQLREFRIGDSLRQVDWKATARLRRPISREYQEERNQQVIVLLDTGRRMLAKDDALSHFDHALNATLVLGYLALRQGDSVGLMTTGEERRWLPAQRGAGAIKTLLNALYDLEARAAATDYQGAASALAMRQRRRALVMWISNLRDDDTDDMLPAIRMLSRRHLVCVASLREKAPEQALAAPVQGLEDALLASGVSQYLAARREAHNQLRRTGVPVLDVTCEKLPGALTDVYLSLKRSGRL